MAANNPVDVLRANFEKVFTGLPRKAGTEAVNFSLDNFKRQGFLSSSFEPWKPVKGKNKNGRKWAILVKRGRLKRSLRILREERSAVVVGSSKPYAKAHNEGFQGTVTVPAHKRATYSYSKVGTGKFTLKGKERVKTVSKVEGYKDVKTYQRRMNLPRRRFLGDSPYLDTKITRMIAAEFLKAARKS